MLGMIAVLVKYVLIMIMISTAALRYCELVCKLINEQSRLQAGRLPWKAQQQCVWSLTCPLHCNTPPMGWLVRPQCPGGPQLAAQGAKPPKVPCNAPPCMQRCLARLQACRPSCLSCPSQNTLCHKLSNRWQMAGKCRKEFGGVRLQWGAYGPSPGGACVCAVQSTAGWLAGGAAGG